MILFITEVLLDLRFLGTSGWVLIPCHSSRTLSVGLPRRTGPLSVVDDVTCTRGCRGPRSVVYTCGVDQRWESEWWRLSMGTIGKFGPVLVGVVSDGNSLTKGPSMTCPGHSLEPNRTVPCGTTPDLPSLVSDNPFCWVPGCLKSRVSFSTSVISRCHPRGFRSHVPSLGKTVPDSYYDFKRIKYREKSYKFLT